MKIKRIYHPYFEWEEIRYNMWGSVEDKQKALRTVVKFISNHELYGAYMFRVIKEWPISCENALTDSNLNRKAWIGHSAVALALQIPEDITRKGWFYLNDEQRLLANKKAERAISMWEESFVQSRALREYVGEQMLLQWDT